ncbi:hypothetical protein [Actinobacillus pleuropneumoniae]|uniref:DUF5067 domain-containing protein n=4 Tax=Actinobacillus pleuropneumoniae TaxID=715 RepID=A3N244_ACTP2|nr:hypothetical protein [Actinobacillus pleuropneumoniae]ABN74480.1 hypothetical protein APL_1396 [Actinobacillus pleuropneumoniae serovar 5b str. L20]ACE62099.1 hypothetical protein APP7_1447 [Actinobacillus pleuropneumoniae serovar 7 str. AP76]ASU15231.1 hypothetical protein CHY23_00438 [Actinobacillus pleuropneumoniae]AWG95823.1 hypothetical protein APPSER1_07640 [Actinobacillus pleuropneumoniae serovar 1 str. 4074]AXA21893.1 hypothetical protein DRF63_07635 [Actinobacillus pleuropneumoniae
MKHIKLLSTAVASFFLAFNAQAEGNKIQPTVEHKSVTKNAPLSAKEKRLKQFNDSIGLRFFGYELAKNKEGQPMVSFKYSIENKTKRNIRIVQWAVNYVYNDKVILTQDAPVTFKDNLKRQTTAELAFAVPVSDLPQEAQAVFLNPQAQLSAQFEARQIVFSNGAKIIVNK